jgi:hypothetical protein
MFEVTTCTWSVLRITGARTFQSEEPTVFIQEILRVIRYQAFQYRRGGGGGGGGDRLYKWSDKEVGFRRRRNAFHSNILPDLLIYFAV